MPSLLILTGAYGSGKTECALTLALEAAQRGPTTLVDLDFVTPYFRAQDSREELEAAGVRVVGPRADRAAIDAPAIGPEVGAALQHPVGETVVDLGGDPAGAVVMGQYAPTLPPHELWAVVSFSRPTTPDVDTAEALLAEVTAATRLRITGLVSNTHLGQYTTPDDIRAGLAEAQVLAARLGVPIRRIGVPAWLEMADDLGVPLLRITPRLLRPWE
jgi:hypothetical protein